jgi:hypothetical protein
VPVLSDVAWVRDPAPERWDRALYLRGLPRFAPAQPTTASGLGQEDGGLNPGTYLELGISPGLNESGFAIAIPLRVGLSLDDYFELAGVDHKFGFLSIGAIASAPRLGSGHGPLNHWA